jgi:hypothetical protein
VIRGPHENTDHRPSPRSRARWAHESGGTGAGGGAARQYLARLHRSELEPDAIEEIIDDARNGRMFILVDHEDRENEGDLVIPAQMATPDAINFMATHGRGLICLALTGERIDALGLPLMAQSNSSRTRPPSPSRSRRARG